jgi:hypothetical protein
MLLQCLSHQVCFSRTKAVANGALAWYVDNPVSARVSKLHYGVEVTIPFDPSLAEMKTRTAFRNKQGELRVEDAWSGIVAKVTYGLLWPSFVDADR